MVLVPCGGVYEHVKDEVGILYCFLQWKGNNHKQSARWQHISRLKASAFCIW
jgi:hypothetical protein